MHQVAVGSPVRRLFAVLLVALLGAELIGFASSPQASAADRDPAVPDRPAAVVSTQAEREVSCADNTRRDRTGTTTTEYGWNEQAWAWEPATGNTVWTDWVSTPLSDDQRVECAGPRPDDTVVTRTKVTESCDENVVVTAYYDTWTRWTLGETNEWISHVDKEVWDHEDTVTAPFSAEECGYAPTVRDEQSWRCQERTPTLVTDHYQRVYAWSPQQKAWVLGEEALLNKDFRAMTAEEQLERGCVQSTIPAAPIWTDDCGIANNGSWSYTDTAAYRYTVTHGRNGKVAIVAAAQPGYVFPAGTPVQWQRQQNNAPCLTVPEQPTAPAASVTPLPIPLPVRIEFPAFDVFDAECQTGGRLTVQDTDQYSWEVSAPDGAARGGAAADGVRTYGPGTYGVSAVAQGGVTFEDGSTRYEAGEVMVDGPDPGVCGYSDDEPARPTKVLGSSIDGAPAQIGTGPAPAVGRADAPSGGTAATPPATAAPDPAADVPAGASTNGPSLSPTTAAAPAISVAPVAGRPDGGQSGTAADEADAGAGTAAANGAASDAAASTNATSTNATSNRAVSRQVASDPAARAAADLAPAPAAMAALASSGEPVAGSGGTPYLVLIAGLFLMVMLRLRTRRPQD